MLEAIVLTLAAITAPGSQVEMTPAPRCTTPAVCIDGSWTGAFGGADWTFEFKREGDGWSGRYTSSRSKAWHPLQSLTIDGGTATFAIISQPQLSFTLKLNAAGDRLAGDVAIAGYTTIPFAATRGA